MSDAKNAYITTSNIEKYLGELVLPSDIPFSDNWDIFSLELFHSYDDTKIVDLSYIVSTKNQLKDPKYISGEKLDPRKNAYNLMCEAFYEKIPKRKPLSVLVNSDDTYSVIDGNATAQVLMVLNWKTVPIQWFNNA